MTESEARQVLLEMLQTKDAKNSFAADYDLAVLRNQLSKGDKRFTVGGSKTTTSQSSVTNAAIMDTEKEVILWCSRSDDHGVKGAAAAIYTANEDNTISINSPSINGELSSKNTVSDETAERSLRSGSDPCGGCHHKGPGSREKRTILMCHDKLDLTCALALTTCAACGPTCLASAGIGCLFCLTTSCAGSLATSACCDKGKKPYSTCHRCSAL